MTQRNGIPTGTSSLSPGPCRSIPACGSGLMQLLDELRGEGDVHVHRAS